MQGSCMVWELPVQELEVLLCLESSKAQMHIFHTLLRL